MSAFEKQTWTVEQYLEMERASEEKHEFLAGAIHLLSGFSADHNRIQGNLYATLHHQLRQSPYSMLTSLMRLKVSKTGLYTYADAVVVADPPQLEDRHDDTLLNPTLIVEVYSPSTESYDRGKKFQHYRALESLQEYVLIAQDSPRIERYTRQENDQWLLTDAVGLDAAIELASIGCTLPLAAVYKKVKFEERAPETGELAPPPSPSPSD